MAQDPATNRTWQHQVPRVDSARTRTEQELQEKPRKKIITTTKPLRRRP